MGISNKVSAIFRFPLLSRIANAPGWILGSCASIFAILGWRQDGINLDSATYAVVARNMAEFGQWFDPHYTGFYLSRFAEHPPLVTWIQGLVFLLVEPNDSTARLFGAFCVVGSVLAAYWLGRNVSGKGLGFLSGLALLLTYNFMQIGNSTLLDVPMAFFVLVALAGIASIEKRGIVPSRAILIGLALGGAWLAKGVVSAPVWIGLGGSVLVWNRSWLRRGCFYLIPLTAIIVIAAHLITDQLYAGGHFFDYYFLRQIFAKFVEGGGSDGGDWWAFGYRFVQLYLPFVIVLPLGIYLAIKKRMIVLYPTLITLLFYIVFYSGASRLYYHYFSPAYALAALFVALPLWTILNEGRIARFSVWFLGCWLVLAAGVALSNLEIHHVRSPGIYSLADPVKQFLSNSPTRNGLFVSTGNPDWEVVAKTAWYWRSDIKQVATLDKAMSEIDTDDFAYVMVAVNDTVTMNLATETYTDDLQKTIANNRYSIFVPRR